MKITTKAIQFVKEMEGGWYAGNLPSDPNPTMFGVIQKTYDAYRVKKGLPKQSVRNITDSEVGEIYENYWNDSAADELAATHPITALACFDHSINAGPVTSVKMLQHAVLTDVDGKLGPKTLAAARAFADLELAELYLWERLEYYDSISGGKLRPNLKSWLHRTLTFKKRFVHP